MSYDLAVWEGARTESDVEADATFHLLYQRYVESSVASPVSAGIREFVAAMLERWPDLTEQNVETCPWVTSSFADNANGPFCYFGINWTVAPEVSAEAAEIAAASGLVCFDPQTRSLR
ncbi:hypothetical protein [Amycolatopsis dongchuanensis]|uniref:Uncharacterized protein n=1 Tax=Amycolatopsis dongchuanensis TaxID=1070866 RepID=A0ABP8VGV7_9PSEU